MENVKVITIGERYRLRDEIGGVTVHDDIDHLYSYYENLFINDMMPGSKGDLFSTLKI